MNFISNYAILGGTFNPVHIAHLRLALEVIQSLDLDYLEFMPSYSPPHKKTNILPYEFRLELLNSAIQANTQFKVSNLESKLASPSYTYNTLDFLAQDGKKPYFIIGLEDFLNIKTWYRGLEIVKQFNLAIISRGNYNFLDFKNFIKDNFDNLDFIENKVNFSDNNQAIYLELSKFSISSSYIRELWQAKQDYRYLVSESVYALLKSNEKVLEQYWRADDRPNSSKDYSQ